MKNIKYILLGMSVGFILTIIAEFNLQMQQNSD